MSKPRHSALSRCRRSVVRMTVFAGSNREGWCIRCDAILTGERSIYACKFVMSYRENTTLILNMKIDYMYNPAGTSLMLSLRCAQRSSSSESLYHMTRPGRLRSLSSVRLYQNLPVETQLSPIELESRIGVFRWLSFARQLRWHC